MPWADSHCHVPYEGEGDADAIVAAARDAGVHRFITIGTDREQSVSAIATAARFDDMWATVGLHPHDAKNGVGTIADLVGAPKVVAIGECGLDYHYDHSPRDQQRVAFAEQLALANANDLALVIHTREAWDDTFDILIAEGVPARTVFHCFTGGPGEARRCLDIGASLSFSGIITFKTADDVRGAAAICPLDRMLVETDAPFLTPVPHRGKRNQPAFVPLVGAGVAAARGVSVEEIQAATWANTATLFGL